MVLQSVFIIRSFNDKDLRDNSSIQLVGASLAASLFSISNKYCWLDKECFLKKAQEAKLKQSCPCINPWYLARIVWRFAFVASRFCALSLLWSVLGGVFVGIFLGVSFCYWCCASYKIDVDWDIGFFHWSILWAFASLISTPATSKWIYACMHGWEMIIVMGIITIFAFIEDADCGICADAENRQAMRNPYILMFIIAGWICMVIDFVMYFVFVRMDFFDEKGLKALDQFFDGFDVQKESENMKNRKQKKVSGGQDVEMQDPHDIQSMPV